MTCRPLLLALLLAAGLASEAAAAPYDFDGDRRQEVVAALPNWTDADEAESGAVLVLPGARGGPSFAERLLLQSSPDVPGDAGHIDNFGEAVASGDFDGDGRADLAIGVPREDLPGGKLWEGAVVVRYGSARGLAPARTQQIIGPDTPGSYGTWLGTALAAGDLDRDGFADLVVGATLDDRTDPEEDHLGSGSVRVVFGGRAGLDAARTRTIARPRRADNDFGSVLALGDIDGDRHVDLVVGRPADSASLDDGVLGHRYFCAGGPQGPSRCAPMRGGPATGPAALAVGDVTGDGLADVVEGVPAEHRTESRRDPHGVVVLRRGTRGGPSRRPLVISQNSRGVPGRDQPVDAFGTAVAVGRLDGDRFADIVVGAPGENRGTGRVTVIRGARGGHARSRNVAWGQNTRGVAGTGDAGDAFGAAVTLLDTDGDRRLDVVVGVPGADRRRGELAWVRGSRRGPVPTRSRAFGLPRIGVPVPPFEASAAPELGMVLGRS